MVTGGGTDHALGFLLFRELGNPVVCATNLEGEHRLKVFTLEHNIVAKALGQAAGFSQRCFDGDVVNPRIENLLDVALRHDGSGCW